MIIGVVGFIGSGKGTVGDILANNHGYLRESFAKPLKDAIAIIFNWPRHLLEGDTKESREWREQVDSYWTEKLGKTITPRLVLQWMGTGAGRNVFGSNLWTAALQDRLDSQKNYVITDVRFENEVNAIRDIGGKIIRVKRGDDPNWVSTALRAKKRGLDKLTSLDITAPDIHISEWDWITTKMDYVLFNNSNLEGLELAVKLLLDHMS